MTDELSFINLLREYLKKPKIRLPIGDDAAVFDKFVITTDVIVENIHFTNKASIRDIIFKLFTANVSDVASMGGISLYCLFTISMPKDRFKHKNIVEALAYASNYYNISIIGGDTTSSLQDLFLSLTVIGKKNKYLLTRSGAKKGDLLFLSRPIGLAQLSLENEIEDKGFNIETFYHYKITAENTLGSLLGSIQGVTACIDISDGLGVDATHLAAESKVKVVIDEGLLPKEHLTIYNVDPLKYILSSGEEYALLFTVSPQHRNTVIETINNTLKRLPTEIGYVADGSDAFLKKDKDFLPISDKGYIHKI